MILPNPPPPFCFVWGLTTILKTEPIAIAPVWNDQPATAIENIIVRSRVAAAHVDAREFQPTKQFEFREKNKIQSMN